MHAQQAFDFLVLFRGQATLGLHGNDVRIQHDCAQSHNWRNDPSDMSFQTPAGALIELKEKNSVNKGNN
jgi:hypothetical protein